MVDKARVRVVRRPTIPVQVQAPVPTPAADSPLSPGDHVEFSTTFEAKVPKGGSFWVKVGAATSVRPGESADEAFERIADFAVDKAQTAIRDLS